MQQQSPEEIKKKQLELEEMLKKNLEKIKHKILVLSNKGGVGKSCVAINMAVYLSKNDSRVGLLDADIHGPSITKMLDIEDKRLPTTPSGIFPIKVNSNLSAVSMASLLESSDAPVVWRGPLKMKVLQQFLGEVSWGELDYLIVDSPPGTGDEPLSICQLIPKLDGGIIVTTPQDIALLDSRKCVNFLRQLNIPILGILENMSGFRCPYCGKDIDLFKSGGGEKAARQLGVPFLGKIPIDKEIVESSDNGKPFILEDKDSEAAKALKETIKGIAARLKSRKE